MQTVFEAAGDVERLKRLAAVWHERVLADEVIVHALSHGFHPQHVERLAAYWAEALGGPYTYSNSVSGESAVLNMHSGNRVHVEMDRRAIACFDQALEDIGLSKDDTLGNCSTTISSWMTTTTMARYHRSANDVPNDHRIQRWSWNGLQD
ncbi:MAG: hypothetical protein R3C60_04105 [Parvularculaceae bacterium]